MNEQEKGKGKGKDVTDHLSTMWYNQDEQLYRTYLESLYLRLRHAQSDKSEVNSLIQKYLKAQQQLLQVTKQHDSTLNQDKQAFEQRLKEANRQIESNEKQIFGLKKDIDTKFQQKQLLIALLRSKLQNFKKVLASLGQTISESQQSTDLASEKAYHFEIPSLDAKATQQSISKIIDQVNLKSRQAEKSKPQSGVDSLQAKKDELITSICQIVESESSPQEIQQLYLQKEETLKKIKATQHQILTCSQDIDKNQRIYDQTSLKNKNLREEINRLKLRTPDELMNMQDIDEEPFLNPIVQVELPSQFDKKDNKRVMFQQQKPKNLRILLAVWAVVLVLLWLIAV